MKYKLYIIAILCFIILSGYYYYTWRKAGVDPRKPVVLPTFKPPHDWSPAAVRYLYKRKYDNKILSVTIINLATKGYLQIKNTAKTFSLIKTKSDADHATEEAAAYNTLFVKKNQLSVSNKEYKTFSLAEDRIRNQLKAKWNLKNYFLKNTRYVVWGTLLNIAAIALLVYTSDDDLSSLILLVFIVPLFLMMYFVLKVNFIIMKIFMIMFLGAFLIPIITILYQSLSPFFLLFIILLMISYISYIYLIKAPTELGAKTQAELEGFRMYLKTAEEGRLNILTPPEHTPELFEKMLPYAIALDVENEWGKKFDNILQQANYSPDWYQGTRAFNTGLFVSSLSHSFSSSVGSAGVSPSSSSNSSGGSWSSGSGGGGSSGGGGGGGGGGGW